MRKLPLAGAAVAALAGPAHADYDVCWNDITHTTITATVGNCWPFRAVDHVREFLTTRHDVINSGGQQQQCSTTSYPLGLGNQQCQTSCN
jgi:hypothetical protein